MYKIRKGRRADRLHLIYTIKEAQQKGLAFKPFNQGPHKKLDWVSTSDNYVLQILWMKDYSSTPSKQRKCRYFYDTCLSRPFTDLNKTYNARPDEYIPRYQRATGLSRLEKFILDQFLKGIPLDDAIKSVTFTKDVKLKARTLLRKKSAQDYIVANLTEIMDKLEIDEEAIVKGIHNLAEDKDIAASVRLSSWLGLAKFRQMGEPTDLGELTEKRVIRLSKHDITALEAEKRYKLQLDDTTTLTLPQQEEMTVESDNKE